jgi:hypothetical protein
MVALVKLQVVQANAVFQPYESLNAMCYLCNLPSMHTLTQACRVMTEQLVGLCCLGFYSNCTWRTNSLGQQHCSNIP